MAISSHCFWPWDRLPGWRWAVPWPRCPGAGLSGGWCTWIAYVSLPGWPTGSRGSPPGAGGALLWWLDLGVLLAISELIGPGRPRISPDAQVELRSAVG